MRARTSIPEHVCSGGHKRARGFEWVWASIVGTAIGPRGYASGLFVWVRLAHVSDACGRFVDLASQASVFERVCPAGRVATIRVRWGGLTG